MRANHSIITIAGVLVALAPIALPRALAQAPAAPAPAATAPTTAAVPTDPAQRLRAPNATQAQRDEAARRLALQQTVAAHQALIAALRDAGNRGAQIAAARAIALDPAPHAAFLNPLLELIGPDSAVTDSAISALTGFLGNSQVRSRLTALALDAQQRPSTRISGIRAVGQMTDKAAAAALVRLVTDEAQPPAVRNAAADALTELTSLPGGRRDAAQWQRWWQGNANLSEEEFKRQLLEARAARLTRLQQRFDRMVREAQAILAEVYQNAPEKSREQILLRYLRAGEPETRAVGVQLVQDDFKQNRPIPPAAREELRAMVGDSSSRVRVMVAQALFLLNDPGARDALLAQLRQERDPEVRAALAEALAPMRDVAVVPALLALLRDESLAVAEVAARGLGDDKNLTPLIRQQPALAREVAAALQQALDARTGGMGTGALRVALIDAMGTLKNAELGGVFTRLLRPSESVPVRRAALRALGKLEAPWAADIIVNALADPNDDVRLEAVNALDTTASFAHAESLYAVMRSPDEKQPIRDRAWQVLRNLFAEAPNEQLPLWADRFREEPERRIEVLKVLAERFTKMGDGARLAETQQNIGEQLMKLSARAAQRNDETEAIAQAEAADKYFDAALQHYRTARPGDQGMITSALLDQRMEALLTSRQYAKAVEFAQDEIKNNPANHDLMGSKLHDQADRLRTARKYEEAAKLIDAINEMNPPLAETFARPIKSIEEEIRQHLPRPQSAVGSGQ